MLAIAAASAVSLAAQEPTSLTPGKAIERPIAGGESHVYRLTLAAGEYAGIIVEQNGIDIAVQLLDAGGGVAAEFDSESRKQGRELVGLVADTPVRYEVRVAPKYPKEVAASYEIRLTEVRPATDRDRFLFEAHKLSAQALMLDQAGKYDEAISVARRALSLSEKVPGSGDAYTGYLLFRLASLKRRMADYGASEEFYLRAIAVSEKHFGREDPQTATALLGLGMLYVTTNRYAEAEPLLREQLQIFEKTLGLVHPALITSLGYFSLLHQNREDLERALAERRRAMEIAEMTLDPDDTLYIGAVANLGDLYSLMHDNARAEPLLQRALAMVEKKYGPEHPLVAAPLQNLGIVLRQNKQYSRALELLWRAERIKEKALGSEHPQTTMLLINIGNLYHGIGDYAQELEMHRRALQNLESTVGPYHQLTLSAMGNVAKTYTALGDRAQAVEYQVRFEEALEKNIDLNLALGSEREKLTYLSAKSTETNRTISLNVREAPDDPAARELAALVLLRRKGRVLDAMSSNYAALRQRLGAQDRKLLEQLETTNLKLATVALGGPGKQPAAEYRKQLAALEQQRETLESEVSARSAEFRAQSIPVTLRAVRAAIPPDAALIEFAIYLPFNPKGETEYDSYGDAHYVAYVLRSRDAVEFRDLGPAAETDDALRALRQALRDGKRQDVRSLARAVDGRIMQPVRQLIGRATQLLISPDGELNLIPFEALVDEHGHYLVEHYSIAYLTSGRDLLRMQISRESRSGPVVFADPLFGERQSDLSSQPDSTKLISLARRRSITTGGDLSTVYFAPLAGTADEARSIKSLSRSPSPHRSAGHQTSPEAARGAARSPHRYPWLLSGRCEGQRKSNARHSRHQRQNQSRESFPAVGPGACRRQSQPQWGR